MGLTRNFRETVQKHVRENPAFLTAMVEEAAQNIIDGEVDIALGQLRDIVNATMGFDLLSDQTGLPKTSLMRMLSGEGNPRAANLGAILKAVGRHAGVRISVHSETIGVLENT